MAGPFQRFLVPTEGSCVGKCVSFQINIAPSEISSKLLAECNLRLFCFSPWVFTNDPNPHDSWGQGGVIQPSAPHWHQWAVFILEQSVCLFIKGVDQNTPQLAGFNPPPSILSSPSLLYIEASFFFPSSCIVPGRPSRPPSLELWTTVQDSYFDRKKRFNLQQ